MMTGKDWVGIAFYASVAIVGVAFFKYGCTGVPTTTYGGPPISCASACAPHPMRSYDPQTGKCECQP